MVESLLIGLVTACAIGLLRSELVNAIRYPTPAGSIFLISVGYLVGATLVIWREPSDMAVFVYSAYALHFSVYSIAYFIFTAGLRLNNQAPRIGGPRGHQSSPRIVGKWAFFLGVFATSIAALYATGADRILEALYRFVAFGTVDVSVLELRLQLASGQERWIAPGYLKQIRDVLLPLSTLILLFSVKRSAWSFLVLALCLIPLVSVLIISSGERAPVLLFLLGAIYAAGRSVVWRIQSARVVAVPVAAMMIVGMATFLALSASFSSRYEGDVNFLLVFADRIFTRVPEENILGASVWSRGAPFAGAGWLSDLSSVLPGTQKTLSNLIHEHLGGGEFGNSVLGAWVDLHYNFGWSIGIAVSVLVGLVIALFNSLVNRLRVVSASAEVCGLWISLCMLMVLSPFGFLLYGAFTTSWILIFVAVSQVRFLMPTNRPVTAAPLS